MTLLFKSNNWTFDDLARAEDACAEIAFKELKLDTYPNQIEIITSDQMLEAYTSAGMPIMYDHWTFGQQYMHEEYGYRKGMRGLAYEIVINSDPCIAYLMEENSMAMQLLVIAHASFGHNHFFKNNYLFKEWTQPDAIIDYLVFAKKYIKRMEDEHGPQKIQTLLNALHSIQTYGVDRYKRPERLNKTQETTKQRERLRYVQESANRLWQSIPGDSDKKYADAIGVKSKQVPSEPQENLLYFIEKNSPVLEDWEREIVRIVRKIAQYFHPQRQTKVMNEGFATSVHYYILNRLYDQGKISNAFMLELMASHAGVLTQTTYNDKRGYSGYNPYALGYSIFRDMKKKAGGDWVDVWLDAAANYKDDSFIRQFLTLDVAKEFRLFSVLNNEADSYTSISGIHDERDFDKLRETLSDQYSLSAMIPDIEIINANVQSDRTLEMRYTPYKNSRLDKDHVSMVLSYVEDLWGYPAIVHIDGEAGTR